MSLLDFVSACLCGLVPFSAIFLPDEGTFVYEAISRRLDLTSVGIGGLSSVLLTVAQDNSAPVVFLISCLAFTFVASESFDASIRVVTQHFLETAMPCF